MIRGGGAGRAAISMYKPRRRKPHVPRGQRINAVSTTGLHRAGFRIFSRGREQSESLSGLH